MFRFDTKTEGGGSYWGSSLKVNIKECKVVLVKKKYIYIYIYIRCDKVVSSRHCFKHSIFILSFYILTFHSY